MPLRWRVCSVPGCPAQYRDATRNGRCPAHRAAQERDRGTSAQRGYGAAHRRRRAELLPLALGLPCPLCGAVMTAADALDLDHSTPLALDPGAVGDRIVHARCNRARRPY